MFIKAGHDIETVRGLKGKVHTLHWSETDKKKMSGVSIRATDGGDYYIPIENIKSGEEKK